MEALSFSETSVLTRATRRNIPEDAILHYTVTNIAKPWLSFWGIQDLTPVFPEQVLFCVGPRIYRFPISIPQSVSGPRPEQCAEMSATDTPSSYVLTGV
jgi:hypothetical protein